MDHSTEHDSVGAGVQSTSTQGLDHRKTPIPSLGEGVPRTKASSKVTQRNRVALACTRCRIRKARCDGQRPSCLACVQLRLACEYQYPAPSGKGRQRPQNKSQLRARVQELESMLRSVQPETPATPVAQSTTGMTTLDTLVDDDTSASRPRTMDQTDSDPDVAVDILATVTFIQEPESNVGHFGPSSNHALFRNISDAFARIVSQASSDRQTLRSRRTRQSYRQSKESCRPQSVPQMNRAKSNRLALPPRAVASALLDHFFASAGAFLPFLSQSTLMSDFHALEDGKLLPDACAKTALLDVVFALASSSSSSSSSPAGEEDSDSFFQRAITCLDGRQLRGASVELVQALLLIATYQQNHQLSITSWTYHALAVKTAFQLGLHSPLGYAEYGLQESELRRRLWYSLINQDRILSLSLGRPCLIAKQYIRVTKPQDPRKIMRSMPVVSPSYADSVIYHNHQISLNEIVESMIHTLYTDNIEPESPTSLQDMLAKRLPLVWELENWRQGLDNSFEIISAFGFKRSVQLLQPDTLRFQLVLSASYYRVMMLVDAPILVQFLSESVNGHKLQGDSDLMSDHIVPIVKHGFRTARELHHVIKIMSTNDEMFLDQTATWWMCSYTVLTVNMTFFCLLLLCHLYSDVMVSAGVSAAEIRRSLNDGMSTMKLIQRTSLMSRHARNCLTEFLELSDYLVAQSEPTRTSMGDQSLSEDLSMLAAPTAFGFENNNFCNVTQAANDFLWQYTQCNLLGDGPPLFQGEDMM